MRFFFLEVVTFLGAFLADCLDRVFAILETTEEEEKSEHHEETHQGHPTMPWQGWSPQQGSNACQEAWWSA